MNDPDDRLFQMLETTNAWLRFAEAKNGATIALAGLAIGAIFDPVLSPSKLSAFERAGALVSAMLLAVSLVASLFSFIPGLSDSSSNPIDRDEISDEENVYFFGTASKMTPNELSRRLVEISSGDKREPTKSEWFLAHQIVTNSRITETKLLYFSWSVRFVIYALWFGFCVVLISGCDG